MTYEELQQEHDRVCEDRRLAYETIELMEAQLQDLTALLAESGLLRVADLSIPRWKSRMMV